MQAKNGLKELTELHIQTYDLLADEYEKRTDALTRVTEGAVLWMKEYLFPGAKILDVGCGVGLSVHFFHRNDFEVVGLDISSKMIDYAKTRNPGIPFIHGDFLATDFDSTFDGVFTFAFVHLFPKSVALKILRHIHSILNPSGILFVGTTKSNESREGYEIKKDYNGKHKRYRKHWRKDELEESLVASGFSIVDVKEYADPFGKVWVDFIARKI